MPQVEIRAGTQFYVPEEHDHRQWLRKELDAWEREQQRGKKRMEVTIPGPLPAASTFFIGNLIDEGYIWSLRLASATLAAAGTLVAYKASQSGDTRRVIGAAPSVPGTPAVTFTTTTAPSVPATGVAVQNPTNQTYQVVISAGGATITNVSVNGITVGTAAGTYYVPAYGAISIAYSVATPTWTWTATQTNVAAGPGLSVAVLTWSSDQARMRHSDGLYFSASQNITEVFISAWQVPAEREGEIYD